MQAEGWVRESELIPGILRTYQATFPHPERGTYSLPVGAGHFTITAQTDDTSIPPGVKDVSVESGSTKSVTFTFPSGDGTLTVTGRLIKLIQPGVPPLQLPITDTSIDLQAVDPFTHRALSQSVPASSTGDFVLFISPEAQKLDSFVIVATPRDSMNLVPAKTFPIVRPFPTLLDAPLQLGDFGDSLPGLKGKLVTTTMAPVPSAIVYLSGGVNGGGVFTSKVVTTDLDGLFTVDLLPSAIDSSYTLTALPPAGSTAGVLQTQVRAVSKLGSIATLTASATGTSTVVCPDKLTVVGSVVLPDGAVAVGVSVLAHAVQQLKELGTRPLPMGETQAKTDASGRFSLGLDPGVYQVDFVPGQDLPRTSRVVTVKNELAADGGAPTGTVTLPEFKLSKARRVTGTITLPNNANGFILPAVNATVRYFHVTTIEGRPSSLLLGEGVSDDQGNYSVVLPAH